MNNSGRGRKIKLLGFLGLCLVGIILYFVVGSSSSSPAASVATSRAAATVTATASASVAGSPTAAATPGAPALMIAMEQDLSHTAALQVQFQGSDQSGSVDLSLQTDGNGNLSGTYVRQGNSGQVILVGTALYMRGPGLINSFTGSTLPPSATGWYTIPAQFYPGVLQTLAEHSLLETCIVEAVGTVQDLGPSTLNGVPVEQYAPQTEPGSGFELPWSLRVQSSGAPHLLEWQVLTAGALPAACNGGVDDPTNSYSGDVGIFTFGYSPSSATISAPPNPAVLPSPAPVPQPTDID